MPVTPRLFTPLTVFDHELLPNLLNCREPGELITFYNVFLQHAEPISKKMQQNTSPDEYVVLAEHAHAIKSSSYSIGAIRLAVLLTELEEAVHAGNRDATATLLRKLGPLCELTFDAIRQHVNELSIR
jgi:HPt (histidine-containing phosphotransfer) domain-containing protein